MEVAIPSKNCEIGSKMDNKFGRCSYFLIVDPDSREVNCWENNKGGESGVGISVAQFLADEEIDVVLTENIGPKALETLDRAGIEAFKASGTIEQVIEEFEEDKLEKIEQPTNPSYKGK